MGLDAVELVIAVEDRFGITIRNDEVARIISVGDLHRLVMLRIAASKQQVCPTLRAFLEFRGEARALVSDNRLRIRPRQRIRDTISARSRRALWKVLKSRFGLEPPELQWPNAVRAALCLLTLAAFAVAFLPAKIDAAILPLSLLSAAFVSMFAIIATRQLCVIPPASLATFGQVARKIAGTRVALNQPATDNVEASVFESLRELIVTELGVDRDLVVPTAEFVRDFGF